MLNSFSQKRSGKITGIHPEYSWLKQRFKPVNPDSKAQDTTVGEIMDCLRIGQFQVGFGSYFEMKFVSYEVIYCECIPILEIQARDTPFKADSYRRPVCSSQGTCINLYLQTHIYSNHSFYDPISKCLAPWSLPPSTLPFRFPPFSLLQIFHLTQWKQNGTRKLPIELSHIF